VSNQLPTVTIIVPARPGESQIQAVEAVRSFDYPRTNLEMIVARGKQPSVQRNVAIKAAKGDLIYFLDDDTRPGPETLRRAVAHFTNREVKMVGGPAVCPDDAPIIEKLFAVALGSWLAFGPSRARYVPVGELRESNEKELILCNLLAHRDALIELGGFDESLYPNEENALMDGLQKRGGKLLYDPEMIAKRRPRPNLKAFIKMLLNYGRGRAEQFRLHPTSGSILNLIPPLFCIYLVVWLIIINVTFARHGEIIVSLATLPLILYLSMLLVDTGISARRHGVIRSIAAALLVVLTPILYGLGFWRGLLTKVHGKAARQQVEVVLEHVRW
jgi:succinoglycan biosynthesis protein ExoA